MAVRGLFKVDHALAISGVGLRRNQWDELVALRGKISNLTLSNNPIFVFKTATGPKELHRVPFRDIYASFRSKKLEQRKYEAKWQEALGVDIGDQWTNVWKGLHETKCSLRVKSNIWRQLNLNFWTAYMDHTYIGRGNGNCCLCNQWARNRWHIILECQVVKKLWQKLADLVAPLGGTSVIEPLEMAFGLNGNDKKTKLRNKLGFICRSTVMSNRGISVGGIDATVDRLWSIFLQRLKKELVEEFFTAKLEGDVTLFESRNLVDGLLGRLVNGCVVWSVHLEPATYNYFDLYN